MADYVVITTQFVKAWADLAKNEYNSSLSDTYCPKKSEIVDTFGCKVRNNVKTWGNNELVATQDVYATYASCTCDACYDAQTTCSCNGGVCNCNSQSDTPCGTNCTSHQYIEACTSCYGSYGVDAPCDSNCSPHSATGSCTSCNGSYCAGCHSGQTNYECGGIEEVK